MRSYSQIIEGLVEMLSESNDDTHKVGGSANGGENEQAGGDEEEEGEEEEEEEGEEEDGPDEYDANEMALDGEDEAEPEVEATIWSTASLSLSPGSQFEVPLNVTEPSICSYHFSVISGTGPIGFSLKSGSGKTLVTRNESVAEGRLDGALTGLLHASLDNSASTFITVTVKCRVRERAHPGCAPPRR